MASRRELQALISLAGRIDPSLQRALNGASRQMGNLTNSSRKAEGGLSKMGMAASVAAGNLISSGLTAIVSKVKDFGVQGIKLASDLTEVQNVVDTTFGKNSPVNTWAQGALKQYGLSELAAKQYTGTLGAMFKSSGVSGQYMVEMSEKLTGLSGDLASFYNLSNDDAFQKIQSGIAGETEPLKQIGINMSVANLQAYALSKGIKVSYQNMDQASQMALRYSYLMYAAKDAQGDFSKTAKLSLANQLRLLQTNFQQLIAKIEMGFLPIVLKASILVNDLMDKFMSNKNLMENIQGTIQGVSGSVSNFMKVATPMVKNIMHSIPPIVQKISAALSPMIHQIMAKAPGIISNIIKAVVPLINTIRSVLMPVITGAIIIFTRVAEVVVPAVIGSISRLKDLIIAMQPALKFVGSAIVQFFSGWVTILKPIFQSVIGIFNGIIDFLTGVFSLKWSKAWKGIREIFGGVFRGLGNLLLMPLNETFNRINTLIAGINSIKMPKILGGGSLNIPMLPIITFANGGFANQPSIFGEAGPEAAIPIKPGNQRSLSLLNKTARLLGAPQLTMINEPRNIGGSSSVSDGSRSGVQSATMAPPITLNVTFAGPVSNREEMKKASEDLKYYVWDAMDEYFSDRRRVAFE